MGSKNSCNQTPPHSNFCFKFIGKNRNRKQMQSDQFLEEENRARTTEIKQLNELVKTLELEKKSLETKLCEQLDKSQSNEAHLQKMISTLKTESEIRKEENAKLSSELSKQSDKSRTTDSKLEKIILSLKSENNTLQQEKDKLSTAYTKLQTEYNDMLQMGKRYMDTEEENKILKRQSQFGNLEDMAKLEMINLQNDLKIKDNKIFELTNELIEKESKISGFEKKLEKLRSEAAEYSAEKALLVQNKEEAPPPPLPLPPPPPGPPPPPPQPLPTIKINKKKTNGINETQSGGFGNVLDELRKKMIENSNRSHDIDKIIFNKKQRKGSVPIIPTLKKTPGIKKESLKTSQEVDEENEHGADESALFTPPRKRSIQPKSNSNKFHIARRESENSPINKSDINNLISQFNNSDNDNNSQCSKNFTLQNDLNEENCDKEQDNKIGNKQKHENDNQMDENKEDLENSSLTERF